MNVSACDLAKFVNFEDMKKDAFRRLTACYNITEEKKCENIKLFDVRGLSGITDYIILATCNSEPHLKAVGEEISKIFKQKFGQICRIDDQPMSGWFVLDAFDVMVHAMTKEVREWYHLDQLWNQAAVLDGKEIFPIDIGEKNTVSAM